MMKSKSADKKLKQARLPFKTISPQQPGKDKVSVAKKRKLSSSEVQVVIKKVFVKENINDIEIIENAEPCDNKNHETSSPQSDSEQTALRDNVDEPIECSQTTESSTDEPMLIETSNDDSNSSKENSVISINDDEETVRKDNSNLETKIEDKKAKEAQVDDTVNEPSHKSNLLEVKTPTQSKKSSKKRQEESAKKKEEKEKARVERLRQKQEKDEQRRKEKEEKDEQKRKDKEEKEEQKRKEKEEKEKKRLAEIEMKNEDKRKREEQKEEERKKRESLREEKVQREKQEKVEAELKQKKAAAAFVNFFVPKKIGGDNTQDTSLIMEEPIVEKYNFMPFSLKADMRLAPIFRHTIDEDCKTRLDSIMKKEVNISDLYIDSIKNSSYIFGKSGKTWECAEKDVVVIEEGEAIVESNTPKLQYRAKLLQFHENRRPPYWGTWIKSSNSVGPRTPFGKDKILDYEIDSDSDWEEEEPGESLHGSEDEKEKESEDEYEVDNDFFVPHGYLSEEEQDNAEEIETTSPETIKVKLKMLQTEFNEEMKKKTEKIKPRLFGCIWANPDGSKPEKCVDTIWNMLTQNAMIFEAPIVLRTETNSLIDSESNEKLSRLTKLPERLLPDLIKLIHGNEYSRIFLIKEFYAFAVKQIPDEQKLEISKSAISRKISEIAKYTAISDDKSGSSKRCWFVAQNYREKYGLSELPIFNTWKYILKSHRKSEKNLDESKKTSPSLSKFSKVINDDHQKLFNASKNDKTENVPVKIKKRATLISVPMGTNFPAKVPEKHNDILDTNEEIIIPNSEVTKSIEKDVPNSSPVNPKSRVNLLASFIKRAEKKYSETDLVESAGTDIVSPQDKIENSAIEINNKNVETNSGEENSMEADDCVLISD